MSAFGNFYKNDLNLAHLSILLNKNATILFISFFIFLFLWFLVKGQKSVLSFLVCSISVLLKFCFFLFLVLAVCKRLTNTLALINLCHFFSTKDIDTITSLTPNINQHSGLVKAAEIPATSQQQASTQPSLYTANPVSQIQHQQNQSRMNRIISTCSDIRAINYLL